MEKVKCHIEQLYGKTLEEVSGVIEQYARENSFYILEKTDSFSAGYLLEMQENWQDHLLKLTVFNRGSEVRIERDDDGFALRVLSEDAEDGEILLKKNITYLLSKNTVSADLVNDGYSLLSYAEYFKNDENSGIPLKVEERFTGFLKKGDENE